MTLLLRRSVADATAVDVRPYLSSGTDAEAFSKPPFVTLHGAGVQNLIANLKLDEVPGRQYFGGAPTDAAVYGIRFYQPHRTALTFVYAPDGDTLVSADKLWWAGLPLTQASQDYLNSLLAYTWGQSFKNPGISMFPFPVQRRLGLLRGPQHPVELSKNSSR